MTNYTRINSAANTVCGISGIRLTLNRLRSSANTLPPLRSNDVFGVVVELDLYGNKFFGDYISFIKYQHRHFIPPSIHGLAWGV